MNNIKNQNLQENFLELCVISVKSEQIGQIGANLVKLSQNRKGAGFILAGGALWAISRSILLRFENPFVKWAQIGYAKY